MTQHGDEVGSSGGWPPPHPSPPLPPPREYGAPGTPPDRRPLIAAVVAALVVLAVVVVLVTVVLGGDDDPDTRAEDRSTSERSAEPSPTGGSTSASPAAPYTCWNGAGAVALSDCPAPDGEAGLRYLFPVMDSARCGKPTTAGGPGVVVRVLCVYRTSGGTKVQLGFFQWGSVDQGIAFYDGQGLPRTDAPDAGGQVSVHTWNGPEGDSVKAASLYADAPYSATLTYPAGATLSAEEQAALAPRPPDQVRGTPAQ